ncbi:MAG: hypothetical protein ACI86M_003751 [Saprospiraceae bacterium]
MTRQNINKMKAHNFLILFGLATSVIFISCDKQLEFSITDSEVQLLSSYIEEANSFSSAFESYEGPKGTGIFGNNEAAVCGHDPADVIGPCLWAIDDLSVAFGFDDPIDVHQWTADAGSIMYDIKKRNDDEFTLSEIIFEIACASDERIITREQTADCYKTNIIGLVSGTLKAGTAFGTRVANQSINLEDEEYYIVGSSFYKLWRYMIARRDCK